MKTVTPRISINIYSDLKQIGPFHGRPVHPTAVMNSDLNVGHKDLALMYMTMAYKHCQEEVQKDEICRQFLAFMDYYTE